MNKFGRILCLTRKWLQKCTLLQVNAPLTEKTWGRDWVVFVVKTKIEDTSLDSRVRTTHNRLQLELGEIMAKNIAKTASCFEWIIKQSLNSAFVSYEDYGDLGECYPPWPTASTDNTLLDLHNSSYDTQPHSLIVKLFLEPEWAIASEAIRARGIIVN